MRIKNGIIAVIAVCFLIAGSGCTVQYEGDTLPKVPALPETSQIKEGVRDLWKKGKKAVQDTRDTPAAQERTFVVQSADPANYRVIGNDGATYVFNPVVTTPNELLTFVQAFKRLEVGKPVKVRARMMSGVGAGDVYWISHIF